ncbi:MAG: M20/M25/M40 family metallo-hydrolase [Gemmatimonadetes bacterium]|nr:M20/M25/M40 family metallo-hydrolase [Gemmatimonadota bacterium]
MNRTIVQTVCPPPSRSCLLRRPMGWILLAVGFIAILPLPLTAQSCPDRVALTRDVPLPLAAVRYLADDALQGRRAGSDGERCAGEYIAGRFRELRLDPAGEAGTFFQSVPLASVLNPHDGGTGRNVLALLPGRDPVLRREIVVVGAHYDHLGTGGPGSLAPDRPGEIHNGADDNASGVAALLHVAQRLSSAQRPARSVLFIAFTGEESGLLGSGRFVSRPTLEDATLVAMLNMDMVGRLGDQPLIVYGVATAREWSTLLEPAATRAGIALAIHGEGYGPSDHTSFYARDVPVLHFFTNVHADYHRPSDDWQRIDAPGLERVAGLVADITSAVANRRPALTLVRGAGTPPANPSTSRGYGAWLGSVPDFTPVERGVKLSGVTPDSPADRAGIRAGDVIVGLGAYEITDLQGMTDALRAHRPGDEVEVRLLRNGERIAARVTLGNRTVRSP